ncbi:mCG1045248, partial [Mus musculus]
MCIHPQIYVECII